MNARLVLIANLVNTAITQARLTSQIQANEKLLASRVEQVDIMRRKLSLGAASQRDVLSLQTWSDRTRADILVLNNSLEQTDHPLAVLTGIPPGEYVLPRLTPSDFSLHAELPFSIPSELMLLRPDIQASEALLHAANVRYGAVLSAFLGRQYLRWRYV